MPKGPRIFNITYDKERLTRFGGLLLFHLFCKSLGLKRYLQTYVLWPKYHKRIYHPSELFLAHLFAIVAGIGRVQNTQSLVHNGLLPPLLGLHNFPHQNTLRDFLWRWTAQEIQSIQVTHDLFRSKLFPIFHLLYSAIVDIDTTVLTVYGNQESVAFGYNPTHRGKKSYFPILASEGNTGLSLGMQLRSGDTPPTTGTWIFLRQILQKLPTTIASSRTRIRADASFYDKSIVLPLDEEKIGYAIVAHLTKPLKSRMLEARYHEFAEGWEAAEFYYTPFNWKTEHRFIAIRRPTLLETELAQRNLFTFQDYTYRRVIVTNLELTPENVYRFYCERGFQELLLREFKTAYTLAQIPTRSFSANTTYMEIVLWAYDLIHTFQFLCFPPEAKQWNLSTIRREMFSIPADWVKHGNRNYLRFPKLFPHQEVFQKIQKNISRIKPLI